MLFMQHKNKQVNLELWREAQTYGDIQLMPFVDYYSLITLKTIAMCIFGVYLFCHINILKYDNLKYKQLQCSDGP